MPVAAEGPAAAAHAALSRAATREGGVAWDAYSLVRSTTSVTAHPGPTPLSRDLSGLSSRAAPMVSKYARVRAIETRMQKHEIRDL